MTEAIKDLIGTPASRNLRRFLFCFLSAMLGVVAALAIQPKPGLLAWLLLGWVAASVFAGFGTMLYGVLNSGKWSVEAARLRRDNL